MIKTLFWLWWHLTGAWYRVTTYQKTTADERQKLSDVIDFARQHIAKTLGLQLDLTAFQVFHTPEHPGNRHEDQMVWPLLRDRQFPVRLFVNFHATYWKNKDDDRHSYGRLCGQVIGQLTLLAAYLEAPKAWDHTRLEEYMRLAIAIEQHYCWQHNYGVTVELAADAEASPTVQAYQWYAAEGREAALHYAKTWFGEGRAVRAPQVVAC